MTIDRIIDVSSAQHPDGAPIKWNQVAQDGVTAAFIKATEGDNYVNPYLQPDMIAAQNNGIAVCAYHFAKMGSPVAEAQFFARTASRFARMLDYETNTNVAWARTFLQTLGLPPDECITYGSSSTLKDFYSQLPSMAFPAAYGQFYPGWGVCWQFTSSAQVAGISTAVDESRWYGNESQYDSLFQINYPEPPTVEEDMELYTTNSAGTGFVVSADLTTKRGLPDAADAGALIGSGLYKDVKLTDQLINSIPDAP
jgi:GH25 family lysozyme M1 (1,4-beta-N-acetylmuramidase)